MESKRLLITGGRWFNLTDEVHNILSAITRKYTITEACEGGATGADELCKMWLLAHNIDVRTFEANWKLFGNRAGNIRNSTMLRDFKPDFAVSFPGGNGTKDMLSKLCEARVPTLAGTYQAGSDEKIVNWRMMYG